jgi:hypothetical protein
VDLVTRGRPAGPLARLPRLRPWAVQAAWAAGLIAVFAANLRLARTRAVNSDGAGNALQAWDMLHGNLLLHGWTLSDVSFYTTELPEYLLVELVRGLNADVVHVAAAISYTLAMLLAVLLAKGEAAGRRAAAPALIAAGIMLAPQLASGTNILLSSPDHIGTSVPVMVTWLILDKARPRWYLPVIAGALLGWAMVADMLVLYIGVAPLVLVSAVRAGRAVAVGREPLAAQWYDLALGAAALAGAAAAVLALHAIHAAGGFYMPAPAAQVVRDGPALLRNLGVTVDGLLLLGGADFLGLRGGAGPAFVVLHLAGVLLAACGTGLAAWRFPRDRDRTAQLLVAGIAVNLAAYLVSSKASVLTQTREIAPVLPFAAALAGRLLGGRLLGGPLPDGPLPDGPLPDGPLPDGRLLAGRLRAVVLVPVLLVVAAGYLAGLARELSQPPAPAQNQQLTSWLAARHLRGGLSGYWESNVVTLTSGGQVKVRTVNVSRGRLARSSLEARAQWYDPALHTADFVVLFPGVPGYPGFEQRRAVLATFGRPARTYHVGAYTVLVWPGNLLRELR